jgi:hypothetical protein
MSFLLLHSSNSIIEQTFEWFYSHSADCCCPIIWWALAGKQPGIFLGGGGDRHIKKVPFGLRQVINPYSPPGIRSFQRGLISTIPLWLRHWTLTTTRMKCAEQNSNKASCPNSISQNEWTGSFGICVYGTFIRVVISVILGLFGSLIVVYKLENVRVYSHRLHCVVHCNLAKICGNSFIII